MTRVYTRWTADEDSQLTFLHDHAGKTFAEIDRILGKRRDAARARYRLLTVGSRPAQRANPPQRRTQRELLDDGLARMRAAPSDGLTLTGMLLGDPPPGRSALDAKRMAEHAS